MQGLVPVRPRQDLYLDDVGERDHALETAPCASPSAYGDIFHRVVLDSSLMSQLDSLNQMSRVRDESVRKTRVEHTPDRKPCYW